jgi:hypothetical protein
MSENNSLPRWPVLLWLILSQLLYLLLLLPWFIISGMSLLAFDAGVNAYNLTFVIVIWSYPLWPLLFSIRAWVAYARKNYKMSLVWTTVPLALILLVVVLIWGLAAAGF